LFIQIIKVTEENPVGRRPPGTPWLRCKDCVEKDVETRDPNNSWR